MKTKIILITLLAFTIYFVVDDLYFRMVRTWIDGYLQAKGISHNIAYALFGVPLLVGTYLMHGGRQVFSSLGLSASVLQGLVVALVCTAPVFIGFAATMQLSSAISVDSILITVIAAGYFEEVFFRGFLFGQLFRYGKLGFVPAVASGALLFAVIHLYQSSDFNTLVGIFLITFLGAILFSWLYAEWEFNIWVPVFLHMLMNFYWELFDVSTNALGDLYANIFRFGTIALTIGITIWYKKKKGLPWQVGKRRILRGVD